MQLMYTTNYTTRAFHLLITVWKNCADKSESIKFTILLLLLYLF